MNTVKETMDKLAADPQTKHLKFHTMQLIPAVEMPDTKVMSINGAPGQPQMFFYAVITLTAELLPPGTEYVSVPKTLSQDDLKEVEQIKQATAVFCKHPHLQPERLYKGYRGPDHWYQVCADCGAEVWNDRHSEYNLKAENGRAVPYSKHPKECNHVALSDMHIVKKDSGGHWGRFATCVECGEQIYLGLPTKEQVQQLVDAETKGMELMQIPIDPIGDQLNGAD